MQLNSYIEGRLIKRYKRFLADVELADGSIVTAHCPNTGSMKNCAVPNSRVWLHDSQNLKRKYPLGWELVEIENTHLCCIDTGKPNHIVTEGIERQAVAELLGYKTLRREVKYGENSRIDILLQDHPTLPDAYVEVKSVTLLEEDGWGAFPDAVTARGAKHLYELRAMVEQGYRGVLLFCVPHNGIKRVRPAEAIDPVYARRLREVVSEGVEVIAYKAEISLDEISLTDRLSVVLS